MHIGCLLYMNIYFAEVFPHKSLVVDCIFFVILYYFYVFVLVVIVAEVQLCEASAAFLGLLYFSSTQNLFTSDPTRSVGADLAPVVACNGFILLYTLSDSPFGDKLMSFKPMSSL